MKYSAAGAYHLHTTGRLWWCRPLAQESRSTSQFATAPRFCSCCSSGAAPPPRRCPFGHGALLEKWQGKWNNQQWGNSYCLHLHTHSAGLGLSPIRVSLLGLYCLLRSIPLIRLNKEKNYQGEQTSEGSFYQRVQILPSLYAYILFKVSFAWVAWHSLSTSFSF